MLRMQVNIIIVKIKTSRITVRKLLILVWSQKGLKQVSDRCLIGEMTYEIPTSFLLSWGLRLDADKELPNSSMMMNKQQIKL